MKRRNKSLLLLIVLLISCACLFANGQQDNGAGDKVTISLLTTNPLVNEDSIALFEEQNPGISVEYEYIPSSNYSAKFSALVASDEIPDVFWTQAGYYVDQVEQDLLLDFSPLLNEKNYEGDAVWRDTFIPALLENAEQVVKKNLPEADNYTYGVPFTMTTIAVLYDKNVYDKLGLKEPADWEEFMNNCAALKDAGYVPLSMQNNWIDWYPRLFWDQYCREELTANPNAFEEGEMTFSHPNVQKGLASFKELWDNGYLPENGITATLETMQQMFVMENLAQFLIAPDKINYIIDNAPESMSLATFALPGINGLPSRSLGGSSNIFTISKTTEHQAEALKLVKFITSKTHFSQIPALKYANSGLLNVESDPALAQLLSGFTNAAKGGFSPDIFVPINVNTEMSSVFKTQLLPNYLLDEYTLEYVCSELQSMYDNR